MTSTPSTEASFVTSTRIFYDAVAEDYAEMFAGELTGPRDGAVLAEFAELVNRGGGGQVADLGCGPGRTTAHLASLGLDVFGLDLSGSMLAIARRENPGLCFQQGSMLELDIPDGTLAGAVSWYSSIHTPVDRLPSLFAEFGRVLAPGGYLLLAFQAGDQPLTLDRPFGHPVRLDFERRRPEMMAELLEAAGFTLRSRTVREANTELGESSAQAFLTGRKTAAVL
ncbi:Methyltransferase domain-containing protein [Streptomyces sp. 3213]|uniref:class I SAM-dependent methyltransferase n=1 Tax=Streptomyces sp. 3213.3 TaxID=1855348 RepID=UPI0008994D88|nr:class I SAM-dependent methyltransferase [Streptomyces sp. 3213.3]SED79665.1 Methyltransferase domain-containing protein [Streptomyces sp. 3213] [Streptomyces sp. 3213.3]